VDSYYKLVKKTEDDPEFDIKRAQKLRRYVESHNHVGAGTVSAGFLID
jgi:type I restriction enzyme R subunit